MFYLASVVLGLADEIFSWKSVTTLSIYMSDISGWIFPVGFSELFLRKPDDSLTLPVQIRLIRLVDSDSRNRNRRVEKSGTAKEKVS